METNTMEKMKKVLLSLCILGVLTTSFVAQNVYAAPEVSTLSASEQQSIYKEAKETPTYKRMPKELKALIKPETITGLSSNQEDPANDGLIILFQDKEDGILIRFDNKGEKRVYARRSTAGTKDITEPVPAPNPKANHFPLPAPIIAQLKKEGTLEKFAPIVKILNENFELSLIMPAFDSSKAKRGEYTGKMLDMPLLTFEEIEAVTQNMDPAEVVLRKKLGFGFKSITDVPNLILSSSGTDCTGWNYVDPKSGPMTVASFSQKDLASRTIVFNAFFNELGMAGEAQSILLQAKLDYYKKLQENFHALMRENEVEPGTDVAKMKGLSAEKTTWALLGHMVDGYVINMEKSMTKINQSKPKEKPYRLNPGKPNYKPVNQTRNTSVSLNTPSNELIRRGKISYFVDNSKTYTA